LQKLPEVADGQVWSIFAQKIFKIGQDRSSLGKKCPTCFYLGQVWAGFGQISCPMLTKFSCEYISTF